MAYAINADGSVIGGWTMDNGGLSACLWRNGVPASLGTLPGLPGFQQPTVYGLSSDGSIAAGTASTGGIDRAFRWSAPGGMQDLGTLAGWTSSAADAISGDGLVIVGGPQRAFRWTDQEGMHDLGVLAGTTLSRALAVNVDGTVIVGTSGERACMWSAATGLVDLNQYLPAIGINLKGWVLEAATGISSDGLTIVGHGRHNGAFEAWRAVLRPDCYANCDGSTVAPALNVADFICFINRFAGGDPRANCDGSTTTPMLNPSDFTCFAASFSAGCP